MSNTFNISRFCKYFGFDLKSRWKDQGLFLVIFAILPIIFHLIYLFFAALGYDGINALFSGAPISRPPIEARIVVFALATGIFLMVFPSRTYGFLTDKAKGSEWIELPASRLEKFTSMMLTCLVVIPVAFLFVYLLSDALVCLIDGKAGMSIFGAWRDFDPGFSDGMVQFGARGLWFLVASVLQTVSVFLLGALLFKKGKISKTILALFVISMTISAITASAVSMIEMERFAETIGRWAENHLSNIDFWFNFWSNLSLVVVVGGLGLWSWFKVKNLQH